jgi:hypothetical protein
MKKVLAMSLVAVAVVATWPRQASAWHRFNFGVGLNLSCEGGGNSFLGGLFKGKCCPGDDQTDGAYPGAPNGGYVKGKRGFDGDPGYAGRRGLDGDPGYGARWQGPGGMMAPGFDAGPIVPGTSTDLTPPKPLPPSKSDVAQPVGYFPAARPAAQAAEPEPEYYYPSYWR